MFVFIDFCRAVRAWFSGFVKYVKKERCRCSVTMFILFTYFCLCGMCFFRRFPFVPKQLLFAVSRCETYPSSALLYASRIFALMLLCYLSGCTVFAGPLCCIVISAVAFCYGFSASYMCASFGLPYFSSTCCACVLLVLFSSFAVDFSRYAAGGIVTMAMGNRFVYYTVCFLLFLLPLYLVSLAAVKCLF